MLPIVWFWNSSLQNCETINICCFKPPRVWYFVMATLGKLACVEFGVAASSCLECAGLVFKIFNNQYKDGHWSTRKDTGHEWFGYIHVYWLNRSPTNVAGALAAILNHEVRSQVELKERRHFHSWWPCGASIPDLDCLLHRQYFMHSRVNLFVHGSIAFDISVFLSQT